MAVEYRFGQTGIALEDVLDLYRASTLGERRPIEDQARMQQMWISANLAVTAWQEGQLVGLARSLTDHVYCTYLSDLAVRVSHQRQGIGRELIRLTRAAAPDATLILLAAPKAVDYYPRLGFSRHESAWILRPGDQLAPA
jgi:GNAT superfamily N-acetyltransferase